MPELKKYYRLRVLGHIFFWLASIAFMVLELYIVSHETFKLDLDTLIKALIPVICFAVAVYINIYVLIPKFLKTKNYIFYGFWLILLMATTSVLIQFLFMYPFNYLLPSENRFTSFDTDMYSRYFFATLIYVGLTSFLKFVKDWLVLQDLKLKYEQIERQKLEAELKTLKGQVHPHFLFNSLNNIYSLSLTSSEKVPELILKLSDLMRHVIYESRENFISLSKELEFVENYISLQKIRVSDKVKIDYTIKGTIPEKRIAPLLFEPFIDNAFKHGLNSSGQNEYVSVLFDFSDSKTLIFSIENSFENSFYTETKYKGIGIDNVKQRLNHLYSEKEYDLTITDSKNIFKILLRLNLKD
jgi:two-component system, LytTR family, sensor kinase